MIEIAQSVANRVQHAPIFGWARQRLTDFRRAARSRLGRDHRPASQSGPRVTRKKVGVALMIVGGIAFIGPTSVIRTYDDYLARGQRADAARWLRMYGPRNMLAMKVTTTVITPGTTGYLLTIPKIDVQLVVHALEPSVFYGINTPTLKRYGVGQVPYTPALQNVSPGGEGTAAITGHRTTSGAPFRHLDALRPGDLILIQKGALQQQWRVVSTSTVVPRDIDSIRSVPGTQRLVLLACSPPFSDRQRVIVYSELVRPAGHLAESRKTSTRL